jgi:predicted O-methyltransferase YrrM
MDLKKANTYISSLYGAEQPLLKEAFIRATELKNFTEVVDDDVARMMKLVILIHKPKRVLEIGTSIGFSTCSMASILKQIGGRITTLEYDPVVAAQAQRNFDRMGLADVIHLRVGDAAEIIPTLDKGYDLIFQDADKRLYPRLLDACLDLLNPGGILMAEDTLFPVMDLDPGYHDLIEPIDRFNHLVSEKQGVLSTLLPLGDGLSIAVKQ